MVQNGGKTIKHEDFNDKLPSLCEDYCHLSFIGNDIILNTFEEALLNFTVGIVIIATDKLFFIFDNDDTCRILYASYYYGVHS